MMLTEKIIIAKIIEALEWSYTYERGIRLTFGDPDNPLPPVAYYLKGIQFICDITGLGDNFGQEYSDVLRSRGWDANAGYPSHQMVAKNLSYEEMTKELLIIEVETWKRIISKYKAE